MLRALQVEHPFPGKYLLMGAESGWRRPVLAAPLLPFWEVFPQEGSTSESGVYVPQRAAIYGVPMHSVAQTDHSCTQAIL